MGDRRLFLKGLLGLPILAATTAAYKQAEPGVRIVVNGDGLEPHLESLMHEILKDVQKRVEEIGDKPLIS